MNGLLTFVMAVSDCPIKCKYQVSSWLFRGNNSSHCHFIDNQNVLHAEDVVDILWPMIERQPKNSIINDYGEQTKEDVILGIVWNLLERPTVDGDNLFFSKVKSEEFDKLLSLYKDYELAMLNYRYVRNVFAFNHKKKGEMGWESANSCEDVESASKYSDTLRECFNTYAGELIAKFYRNMRKDGKHIYVFEFRNDEPLASCRSIWEGVPRIYLAHDD